MGKLINDTFVRFLAQVLVGAALTLLCLIAIAVNVFVLTYYRGALDGDMSEAATFVFDLLAFPFEAKFGAIILTLGSIVPVVLSTVFFGINSSTAPPKASDTLNSFGKTMIVVMLVGILASGTALLLFNMERFGARFIAENPEQVKVALTGLLSFQAVYFTQLLGLKPK